MVGQEAMIFGYVFDQQNKPLEGVSIQFENLGTLTDDAGYYELLLPPNQKVSVVFTHLGRRAIEIPRLKLSPNERFNFNPVLSPVVTQLAEVEVSLRQRRIIKNVTVLPVDLVLKSVGVNAGIENFLKVLPGVSFNNEMSSQYNVRGGNFEENLVYVNGIEVYRPFLIRSAQQEGLSIINPELVQDINFSAGGFEAKYGDRLSSVLDISYQKPVADQFKLSGSFLGGNLKWAKGNPRDALSGILGLRYRNNSLFINSLETQGNTRPEFIDLQSYWDYSINPKSKLGLFVSIANNNYENIPQQRRSNFGTLTAPRALIVDFEGRESTNYQTAVSAIKWNYAPRAKVLYQFQSSLYRAIEREFTDVISNYSLGSVNNDLSSDQFGEIENPAGSGRQFRRARNELDALIASIGLQGKYQQGEGNLEWGLTYRYESIKDLLDESEFIDSAGFFIRPPNLDFANDEPQEPYSAPIVAFNRVSAQNEITTQRLMSHIQWNKEWESTQAYWGLNLGIRSQVVGFQSKTDEKSFALISPRAQLFYRSKNNENAIWKLAMGSYQQPPLYREYRKTNGSLNPNVLPQRSWHLVASNERELLLWGQPMKLVSEAYYKDMNRVNTYTIEDVRIRYRADNLAYAYATGLDLRLNGTFVPGVQSWVSLGYLVTKENYDNQGYVFRPTDQRLKFALFFQDYMPTIPNLKLNINMVYQTGVLGGSPPYEASQNFQRRLNDYKRADLGLNYVLIDKTNVVTEVNKSFFDYLSIGVEVFNIFDNQNSITNTWVRDAATQNQFAIPNILTRRLLNLKFEASF